MTSGPMLEAGFPVLAGLLLQSPTIEQLAIVMVFLWMIESS